MQAPMNRASAFFDCLARMPLTIARALARSPRSAAWAAGAEGVAAHARRAPNPTITRRMMATRAIAQLHVLAALQLAIGRLLHLPWRGLGHCSRGCLLFLTEGEVRAGQLDAGFS